LHSIGEKKCYLNEKEIPQRITLISPTAHSDSNRIFRSLKNLDWDEDVITEYSDDVLKENMEEVKLELEQSKEYKEYKRVYEKFKKEKVEKLTEEECELLYKSDFVSFKELKPPKYP
jgi:hypothetical protein